MVLVGVMSADKPSYTKNSILKVNLNMVIPEKSDNLMQFNGFFGEKSMGMNDILELIDRAKTDENIEGILIESSMPQLGMANALTIRGAIDDFKTSGKFVYAYASNYSQMGYYLSSTADSVFLNPNGMLDLKGLSISMPYFKDMMDAIGIKWNIYYAGQFKSATEPFRRNGMSDQNRLQLREFINEVYDNFVLDIAKSRKISVETIDKFAGDYAGFDTERALSSGLVDALIYQDELTTALKNRLGLEEKKNVKYVDLFKYKLVSTSSKSTKSKNTIAVVYAEGNIVDAGTEKGMISAEKYVETLAKIRSKKNIKAVVLRINSGGGSGFASDEIWREIELIKEAGKPVIISMGDYAASGGYYIACNADSIVASPNSLTGSIGVFAMMPNFKELSEEKLKVHFDSVKTHQYANAFDPFFEYSDGESEKIQTYIDKFYEKFLARVAKGRNMTRDEVHEVAQGRIWTGRKAKEIGLVDELGELDLAIRIAAEKADLEDYKLSNYPKFKKNIVEEIIKNMNLEAASPLIKIGKTMHQVESYSDLLLDQSNFGKPQMLLPIKLKTN